MHTLFLYVCTPYINTHNTLRAVQTYLDWSPSTYGHQSSPVWTEQRTKTKDKKNEGSQSAAFVNLSDSQESLT